MTEEQFQEAVNAVGALAELLSLLRDALERNGFDEDSTLYLLGVYLEMIVQ